MASLKGAEGDARLAIRDDAAVGEWYRSNGESIVIDKQAVNALESEWAIGRRRSHLYVLAEQQETSEVGMVSKQRRT